MSHKESIALAQAGQPQLFTKFKSRTTKEVESPKSVISDPRIVSPASSASASLERRLSDLKKLPRHDRVYSISDAEDENALPSGANVHAVLTRQLSAKDRDRDHNGLESVSEAPSLPSVPARMGLSSGPSSETSSPRNRIGRSINKDGSKVYVRGSDSEFLTRRLSSAGADSTSSSGPTTLLHPIEPQGVETDKMSFTFSPPKSLAVGVLDRNSWRNAAGIRSLSSKSLEPLTGSSRLRREDGPQATTSSSNSQPWVGSMYDMLVNSINGPLEQIVSGRGKLRSRSEACIKDCSIVQIGSGLAYEDQIEFNKFLVRGSNGEEIRARELKMVFPLGSARAQELRDEFGDGRSGVAGYRHSKGSKSVFSPGDSPGHPRAFGDWPRSALIELSPELVVKETSKFMKEFPEMPYGQKESAKALSNGGDAFESVASVRLAEGRRKSESHVSGGGAACIMFPSDGHPSLLHALPPLQSHGNAGGYSDGGHYEKHQYGGKYPGVVGESIKTGGVFMPQQRFVSGQYLKSNPLQPRPQPAKWDDAEKWIVNPATSRRSSTHSSHGNGPLSGGSTPQHVSQHHLPSSGRHHLPRSAPSNADILQPSAEAYDARLLPDNGDVGGNSFPPSSGVTHHHHHHHNPHARDASTTTSGDGFPADVKQSDASGGDGAAARPEGKVHPLPDGALVKANLLLVANKLARERSDRGPGEDFCESKELQEPLKSPPGCSPVDTTQQASFDQKHDAYSATIFDNFTKDKFADSITVHQTPASPNNGRLVIVMKDAATEITPSTSQRDIATQITPVQSFHAVVTPPRIHTGPARLNTTPVHSERRPASVGVDVTELQNCHQAKLELDQAAAIDNNWTTREEEVEESAKSLRLSVDFKEVKRNVLEARAAAWEEAEQSKYMSRYHREEAKILAWEAHQKAKAEAEMRKMEVKLERMRSHASEILQNKIASVHLRAENMRAAAAAQCGEQAAKTNQWAQEIRSNGRSSTPPILCCFPSCFSSPYAS